MLARKLCFMSCLVTKALFGSFCIMNGGLDVSTLGPLRAFTCTATKLIAVQTSSKDRGSSWNTGTCVVNSNTRLSIWTL